MSYLGSDATGASVGPVTTQTTEDAVAADTMIKVGSIQLGIVGVVALIAVGSIMYDDWKDAKARDRRQNRRR